MSGGFRRSRRGYVAPTWDRAMELAGTWTYQLNRRHRVRCVSGQRGRVWMVERATGQPSGRVAVGYFLALRGQGQP